MHPRRSYNDEVAACLVSSSTKEEEKILLMGIFFLFFCRGGQEFIQTYRDSQVPSSRRTLSILGTRLSPLCQRKTIILIVSALSPIVFENRSRKTGKRKKNGGGADEMKHTEQRCSDGSAFDGIAVLSFYKLDVSFDRTTICSESWRNFRDAIKRTVERGWGCGSVVQSNVSRQ